MEPNTTLDWILGGIAITILIVGMLMLLGGISEMNKK
ncbi:MAG: NAD synthetase [Crocosphaera sp.]|nr:NAD synthetase [Crocosphaera sp.]MDJ0579298.1 NAD synthetase [Crocosphaera sp.]